MAKKTTTEKPTVKKAAPKAAPKPAPKKEAPVAKKAAPKKAKVEAVVEAPKVEAPTSFAPKVGEMFLCDGFIGKVTSETPFTVVRCVTQSGVITDQPLDFPSLEGHNCIALNQGEAMRMLNG